MKKISKPPRSEKILNDRRLPEALDDALKEMASSLFQDPAFTSRVNRFLFEQAPQKRNLQFLQIKKYVEGCIQPDDIDTIAMVLDAIEGFQIMMEKYRITSPSQADLLLQSKAKAFERQFSKRK